MKTITSFFIALLLVATASLAGDSCPCVPITRTWVVTACETWNCAQAALVLADGDPFVISLPTNDTKYPWVIARRVISGSAATSTEGPYMIESNRSFAAASTQFLMLDPNTLPMLVTATDGATLTIRLREAAPAGRRRASAH